MLQKQRVRLRNISNSRALLLLRSRAGNSMLILCMVGMLVITFFGVALFQRQQLNIVTGDVSTDITTILTTTASSHLYDSFAPVRDGTSGAVMFDGVRYREIKNTDKFRERFSQLYRDVELKNGSIIKKQHGREVFTIADLRLYVSNASGGEVKSYYRVEYTLSIPNGFLWVNTATVLPNQVQTVEYMNKF